jgi:hypothetical protein
MIMMIDPGVEFRGQLDLGAKTEALSLTCQNLAVAP